MEFGISLELSYLSLRSVGILEFGIFRRRRASSLYCRVVGFRGLAEGPGDGCLGGCYVGRDSEEVVFEGAVGFGGGVDHFDHDKGFVVGDVFFVEGAEIVGVEDGGVGLDEVFGLAVALYHDAADFGVGFSAGSLRI